MQIDILQFAEVIGAASVILGVIVGAYKLYDKLIDRIDALEKRMDEQDKTIDRVKKEDTLVIYALRACLDGLHQLGCNGKVTKTIDMIEKHINKAAHEQE